MCGRITVFHLVLLAVLSAGSGCGPKAPPERIGQVLGCALGSEAAKRVEFRSFPAEWSGVSGELEISAAPYSFTVWRVDFVAPELSRDEAENMARRAWRCRFSGGRCDLPGSTVEIMPAYDRGPRGRRIRVTDKRAAALAEAENARPEVDLRRRTERAREEIVLLEEALEHFFTDTGVYPRALTELTGNPLARRNWNGPYCETVPRDPWGAEYRYRSAPDGGSYRLYSTGADGNGRLR